MISLLSTLPSGLSDFLLKIYSLLIDVTDLFTIGVCLLLSIYWELAFYLNIFLLYLLIVKYAGVIYLWILECAQ